MNITVVNNPEGITHFHNGKRYKLVGRRYLLTMDKEELKLLPSIIIKRLTIRGWSEVCECAESDGQPISCFLWNKHRWKLLMKLAGNKTLDVRTFLLYIGLTEQQNKKWRGREAFTLISFLFSQSIDSGWRFVGSNHYGVERTDKGEVVITVPSEQYIAFLGGSSSKTDGVIDLFRNGVKLIITIEHKSS